MRLSCLQPAFARATADVRARHERGRNPTASAGSIVMQAARLELRRLRTQPLEKLRGAGILQVRGQEGDDSGSANVASAGAGGRPRAGAQGAAFSAVAR